MNNELNKKEKAFLEEGYYAKQDMVMSIFDFYKVGNSNIDNLPKLNDIKTFNGLTYKIKGDRPTYRDALILQGILAEAGDRLYEEGHSARVNENSPEKHKTMVKTSKFMQDLGLKTQIVLETSFYRIMKKCGMKQGSNSKKTIIDALERLGSITHMVYKESDYKNGIKHKGFNEQFISYEFDAENDNIRIKLNASMSTALTGQFTLINIRNKTSFIKNEKYLAVYDFISSNVNKGKKKSFFLDDVINTVEHIPDNEVHKDLRKKYKKIIKTMEESQVFGKIETGGKGKKSLFVIDRVF